MTTGQGNFPYNSVWLGASRSRSRSRSRFYTLYGNANNSVTSSIIWKDWFFDAEVTTLFDPMGMMGFFGI